MKPKTVLKQLLATLCMGFVLWVGATCSAQNPNFQYSFLSAPYDSTYIGVVAADSLSADSILAVQTLSRPSLPEVGFVFVRQHFYLLLTTSGQMGVYLFPYFDDADAYAGECALNGISPAAFSHTLIINALIRYYKQRLQ